MIKYHDNMHGEQYGSDHMLTNNWNSKGPFRDDEYINVCFRIDVDSYVWMDNCWTFGKNEAAKAAFYGALRGVLDSFGIPEETYSYIREKAMPDMESLFIHPQNISGTIRKSYVEPIAEALDAVDGVHVRWVDLYGDVSPMTNEEYRAVLDSKRSEIKEKLLEVFKTKRRNLYITSGAIDKVERQYETLRREHKSGYDFFVSGYIGGVVQELVTDGKLIQADTRNGVGYRTATPRDKKIA